MNKRQKAVIIIWVIVTALLGLAGGAKVFDDGFSRSAGAFLVLWVTISLISGVLFWMFSDKNHAN